MKKFGANQRGATMLEVLVAIVVLSLGLLGMLGVMMNSLKLTTTSNYRSIAAQEAYAMAEMLRASTPNLAAYSSPAPSATAACMTSAGCTTAQIVSNDMYLWQGRLAAMLPSGAGTICRDSTVSSIDFTPANWQCDNTGQYVVKVCWDESRVPGSPAIQCVQTNI